ncbi:uncharacterized protein LOC123314265 [Coccinella septempunctata]|uniref:uncharacterized protein LOC123314265 n=1 Tax=Coccinella septempunctata TaxID=41139 RepID=UPI001D081E0B|nr:uncharacterized protein LOC123314265 [Coccinella septempunctata]
MEAKLLVIVSLTLATQCPQIYGEDHASEDFSNFAELAAELFQSQGGEGLGSMVQGLMGSAISGVLSGGDGEGAKTASNLGRVLQGLGNMVGPNARGIDTDVLSGIVGMVGNSLDPQNKEKGGVDVLSVLSTVGGVLSQPGNAEKLEHITGLMPLAVDFFNSIYGPEAQQREKRHAEHAGSFPPLLETFHLMADHFLNSEFGKNVMKTIGAEKIIKIFSDETGKFSYDKFVELMENLSFRRHWIHMVTLRIGKFVEYYSDPKIYEKYATTLQLMINSYLTHQGYPKSVLLDPVAPVKSTTALVDFMAEKYLGTKINSKHYVQPMVSYVVHIFGLIKEQGRAKGGTEGISAKLADSINLEIIEPIARVNRAYRFLKKNPKCDRYVLCLVNQKDTSATTIPGLKMLLSKGTSFVASWALSTLSEATMLEYFNLIMYEDQCQKYFKPACSDFHEGEVKVTTEYIHNEL